MRIQDLDEGVGRIVKGVNTTPDVDVNQTSKEAAKFGFKVDKDGRPPLITKKSKNNPNTLFNLGLTEGIKLQLERDKHIDILHIMDTTDKQRIEVRGKKGYETEYDPKDKLHQVLDRVGKAANISELMNGEVVSINPNHPQGARAIRTAQDVLQTEQTTLTAMQKAVIEGGHDLNDLDKPTPTIAELVKMHGVPAKVILDQLTQGIEAEYEHTSDFEVAKQIAMDHLGEDPYYYDKLKFIENSANDRNIAEALDNPYPFSLQGPGPSHNFLATAETANGMLRMDFKDDNYDEFSIDFAVGKSMGKTDAGDEFRVFATVVAMMKQWINTVGIEHVESFDFAADKVDHDSDGRARLYARFAKQLASQLGWELEQSTTANRSTAFFRLVNPKPVPRHDDHFDDLEDNPELEENFADGKKKGKSRPGRVKKSGASCKGSVTSLRKRAKKASGEKAKMYHWCANMKSGRKKK